MEQKLSLDNLNEDQNNDKLAVMTAKFQQMKKERDDLAKENKDLQD